MLGVLVGAADADQIDLLMPTAGLLADEAEELPHLHALHDAREGVRGTATAAWEVARPTDWREHQADCVDAPTGSAPPAPMLYTDCCRIQNW